MKKIINLTTLLSFIMAFYCGTINASTTKVLINVVQEQGEVVSSALIKETEVFMAKQMLSKDFDVITSDDLSAMRGLSSKELDTARAGGIPELRKAAAINGAAFIISAKARTQVNQEEVLNMQMSKAVTSVAYRIINTGSGRTVDMDSLSFSTAGRSGQEATHSNYRKMSLDIAKKATDKLPAKLGGDESRKLANYKASLAPKPVKKPVKAAGPVSKPVAEPQAKTEVAQAIDNKELNSKDAAEKTAAKAPELVILNPPATRGFRPVARQKELTIEGLAIDPTGISEVRINGEKVGHDQEGRFKHQVSLGPGENRFLIMAVNTAGRMASKDLAIDRTKDSDPPELVLLRPHVTRGFQVALKPEIDNTVVEGIVKDESEILFVRVNDKDVKLSDSGHFQHEMAIKDSTGNISIETADIHGNITRKSLKIARGEGAWALSSSGSVASAGPGKKPVLWGLIIGVSKYSSSSINLRYADRDAMELEKFFKTQEGKSFSEIHLKTLVNENVTRNSIIENITTHLGKAAPNDVIFIFLAGHGIKHRQSGSYYFMPSDSDFNNILSTGMRMSDFEESIRILSNNVNKIIVAMDTCHSGALEVGMRSVGGGEDLAGTISAASGLYILSASKAGEVSLESNDFKLGTNSSGHGAFTYSLVNAMRGEADYDRDGYVSVNEVFQFVARQVPRLTNGQQHPYFRMQGTDLPLLKIEQP
ncbi:MAG TPA: caspase family protein [Desulfobacteraceae bacterium]|nr:caspase family protein [Desulfobacteraceae bacterium]HPJ68161.1 caspase family protein [Desulfobacteraceae bacterium]HPQ29205.1 caspase family protein [Desulfobacteraceae bacterium]